MSKAGAWLLYWSFVGLSWPAAALFLFTGGWSSCTDRGSCLSDGIWNIIILLLLPIQAALAAWLRSVYEER
jgi:hypothetical protein